jgi:hypothetical protein
LRSSTTATNRRDQLHVSIALAIAGALGNEPDERQQQLLVRRRRWHLLLRRSTLRTVLTSRLSWRSSGYATAARQLRTGFAAWCCSILMARVYALATGARKVYAERHEETCQAA